MKNIALIINFCVVMQYGYLSFGKDHPVADVITRETFFLKVIINDSLKNKGFSTNKESVISGDSDSVSNVSRVFINFLKEFHGVVTLTAYDVTGFKMGDCKMPIDANAGDALYFDFHFDNRVDIEQDTKLVLW